MMPTSPSSPLKFRAAGFPQYGLSGGPAHATSTCHAAWLTSTLRAPACKPLVSVLRRRRCAPEHRHASGHCRSTPGAPLRLGYVVPVHHHLLGPIRPTRGHIAISPHGGLYAMSTLCHGLGDPRLVPCFHGSFCLDMPPSTTPGSSPSYLHGHSALSCASSRHSGGKELLTGSESDPGHGSAYFYSCEVRSPTLPASSRDARARGVPVIGTAVSAPWSRSRVD